MKTQRNWDRQMWSVIGLAICPRDFSGGELSKFETEECGHSVMVSREYSVGPHAPNMRIRACVIVGQRGGRKVVYNSTYY